MKNAIVWTTAHSIVCQIAVKHMQKLGYTVEERNVSNSKFWTKTKLLEAIPGVKTLPQVVVDGTVIGGIKQLHANPAFAIPKTTAVVNKAQVSSMKADRKKKIADDKAAVAQARKTRIAQTLAAHKGK